MKTAEDLRIKGLAQMSWPADGNETVKEGTQDNSSEGHKKRLSDDGSNPQLSVSNGSESPANKKRRPNSYSPKVVSDNISYLKKSDVS